MPGMTHISGLWSPSGVLARSSSWWDQLWFAGMKGDSTFADGSDAVFFYVFWVSALFFVLLMVLMVAFAIRYRRKPGTSAPPSPSHHTALELAWSIIPTILLAIMFFWGFREYMYMQISPANSEQIDVLARQWGWTWTYDNGATTQMTEVIADMDSPVFALPAGRPVKFLMSSEDVIHSMYIPAFRIKRDVFPNRFTTMWVEPTARAISHVVEEQGSGVALRVIDPNNPGYYLACAEYCGDNHAQMWARVVVLSDADYLKWKSAQASTESIPLRDLGELLHKTKGCVSCHSIDGSSKTGPTWKGIWGTNRAFDNGTSLENHYDSWENYVRESILVPDRFIVAGYPNQMVSYQGRLADREIRALATFIKSLSDSKEDRDAAASDSEREMAERAATEGSEE